MAAQAKHHDYHLVDPSPWPAVGSISAFIMAVGAITWMHHMTAAAPVIFGIGAIGVLTSAWVHYYLYFEVGYRDIAPESFAGLTISRAFAITGMSAIAASHCCWPRMSRWR